MLLKFGKKNTKTLETTRRAQAPRVWCHCLHGQKLAKQADGDRVADLLVKEAILSRSDRSFGDWLHLYSERRSRNMTARVAGKSVTSTTELDRQLEERTVLQKANADTYKNNGCCAFVRLSADRKCCPSVGKPPVRKMRKQRRRSMVLAKAVVNYHGGVCEQKQ